MKDEEGGKGVPSITDYSAITFLPNTGNTILDIIWCYYLGYVSKWLKDRLHNYLEKFPCNSPAKRTATAAINAAPFPLPSSDNMYLTRASGTNSLVKVSMMGWNLGWYLYNDPSTPMVSVFLPIFLITAASPAVTSFAARLETALQMARTAITSSILSRHFNWRRISLQAWPSVLTSLCNKKEILRKFIWHAFLWHSISYIIKSLEFDHECSNSF